VDTLKISRPEQRGLHVDWVILGTVLALTVVGIITIWGAAASDGSLGPFVGYARRQLQWTIVGLALAAGFGFFDYRGT